MKRIKTKTNRIFIKGIKLDKFKAFSKEAEIKLSPMVNLIFGRNSSGKSSILQALRLIRQSYERDQLTPFNLESPEKYKDNGGIDIDIKYKGIISDNNEQDNLSLGLRTGILSSDNKTILNSDKEIVYKYRYDKNFYTEGEQLIKDRVLLKSINILNKTTNIKFKLSFEKAKIFDETSNIAWNFANQDKYIDKKDFVNEVENYKSLYSPYYYNIKLESLEIGSLERIFKKINSNKKLITEFLKLFVDLIDKNKSLNFKKFDFKSLNEPLEEIRKAHAINKKSKKRNDLLEKFKIDYARFFLFRSLNFGLREFTKVEIEEMKFKLTELITNLNSKLSFKQFKNLIINDCKTKINRLCYFRGKFLLNPEKQYDEYRIVKKRGFGNIDNKNSVEDRIVYLYDFICEAVNYYTRGIEDQKSEQVLLILRSFVDEDSDYGTPPPTSYNDLNLCMNKMYIIPGLRSMPKRYFAKGIQTSYVGARAEYLAESLAKPDVKKMTNEWLNKLDIPYSVDVINVENHYEIIWKPKNKKMNIFANHIGLGYPLILPFIVQCLTANNKIIVVEEPEVHLHPKLQADLGDLIVESSIKNNNQIILETHSEDLLLRVLKKVRDKKISPDLISANYVLKEGNKPSEIKKININSDGQYFTSWKDDIFAERLKEFI